MKNFNFKGFQFPKTDAEKVRANVEAVALVKELEKTQQQATAEQQAVLAKYVGWGGLANVFFDRYAGKFEEERTRLESLVTPTEYQAMQKSSLTAYYTDTRIVEQMWDYLIKNGFKGGNILDPSMATGIFFGTMPKEIQENSTLVGVELDTISGLIAKQLFPEATILIQGFETVEFDGKPFDLIMTNVPFSEFRISDTNYEKPYVIHDYFLRKSVDLLNENGVIGFVTSVGTANKRSNSILKEIKDEVAFLGGVRLPSSAFKELAGTKVSSDILFFEKDRLKTKSSNEIFFEDAIRSDLDKEGRVFINPYFENNQVLGDYEIRYFNGATLSVKPWKDSDLFLDIKEGLSSIYAPTFAGYSVADVTILSKVQSQSNVRPYEYGFEDGKVVYHNGHGTRVLSKGAEITFYQDANGKFVSWDKKHGAAVIEDFEALRKEDKSVVTSTYISPQPSVRGANKGLYKGVYFYEKPLEDKEVARVKGMIAIKEAYQSVIDIQSTDDYDIDEFQSLLTELNETYDMFVKEYGYINTPVNTRLFERDDRFPLIASLEEEALDDNDSSKVVFEKAKAFFEPTIRPKKSLEQVDSAEKALSISLSEGRGVDLDFMLTLYPAENKEVLLAEIFNEVAPNIQKYSKEGIFEWGLKTDLLSGDVVTKKELLELLVDNVFKIYQRETINRGTQMIFSDIGTPSTDGFSIYSELKNLLVDRGVPEEEIAFIHDAKNKDAKLQLQRKMNAGEVRILLASTEKGGTGLNVQRRMKAVHHIDVPWKPSDIIQRNGRIVRQGNLYNRVQIYYYITTGSFDNYLWQIQETKLRYISQIMTSSTPVRSASDIDEQAMTASDFKAIATGNPFLKMRIELENELDLLSKRKVAWKRDFELSQKSVKSAQERIEATNRQLSKIDLDIEQANATKKEEVTVGEEKIVKNPFVMEFTDGYTTESTFKAGNQLAYTMQFNVSETTKFVTLAKYRGFELKARTLDAPYRQGQALDLKVVGKNMYTVELDFTSPVGTIQRINNVIDSLGKTKIRLEQLVKNQQLIVDKGIADSVFADEERLAYVKAKYEVLLPLLENDASVEEIEKALEEFSKQHGSEDKSVNVLDKYLEVSQDDVEEIQLLEPQTETVEVPSEEDSERPEREEDNSDKLKLALQFLADAELLLGQADEPTEVVFTSETTITVCEQLELF